MKKIREFFSGKKVYIVSILLALVALTKLLAGDMTVWEFINSPALLELLAAFGLTALRAAIAKND